MTYEIAKRLDDAGFPFRPCPDSSRCEGSQVLRFAGTNGDRMYFSPTITDLIEACGKDFAFLARGDDGSEWKATAVSFMRIGERIVSAHGSTAEEAVAKLWLALQEN